MNMNEEKRLEESLKAMLRDVPTPEALLPVNIIEKLDDAKKKKKSALAVRRIASLAAAFVVIVGGALTFSAYMNTLAKAGQDEAAPEAGIEETMVYDSVSAASGKNGIEGDLTVSGIITDENNNGIDDAEEEGEDEKDEEKDKSEASASQEAS